MKNVHSIPVVTCDTQSIEEFAGSLDIFDAKIIQLSKGEFSGASTLIDLGDVSLLRGKSATKYQTSGRFADYITFCFPLDDRPFYTSRGLTEKRSKPVSLGNCEFDVIYPENFDHIVVSIKRESLPKYLSEDEIELFEKSVIRSFKNKFKQEYSDLATKFVCNTFSDLYFNKESNNLHSTLATHYCRLIIGYLFEYLSFYKHRKAGGHSNYSKIISRGFKAIASNGAEPLDMEILSNKTYSSKRSIQYAFAKMIGMSPMQFIRTTKLNQIRETLLFANPGEFKVSDVLSEFKISNQGRFNQEYFDFFLEQPKQTLKQAWPLKK